jgi:hypothetical protein
MKKQFEETCEKINKLFTITKTNSMKNDFEEIANVLDDCMQEAAPYRYIELSTEGLNCVFVYRKALMKFVVERLEKMMFLDAIVTSNFGDKFYIHKNLNLVNIGTLKNIDDFLNYSLRKEIRLMCNKD